MVEAVPDADQHEQDEAPKPDRYEGHRSQADLPEADVLDQESPVQPDDEGGEEESESRRADDEPEWT